MGGLAKAGLAGAAVLGIAGAVVLVLLFGLSVSVSVVALIGMPAVLVAAVAAVLTVPRRQRPPALAGVEVPSWVVGRPAEVNAVVAALVHRGGMVGITTGLHGAGGFGKTTLATMVCADRHARRHFGDWVYSVTIGRRAPASS